MGAATGRPPTPGEMGASRLRGGFCGAGVSIARRDRLDEELAASAGNPDTAGAAPLLRLDHQAMLYRRGEPRTCIYRIEKGIVALLGQVSGGQREIVEFAFAGDALGYGLFERHTSWAQAVGEVCLRSMPLSALDTILRNDPRAFDRYTRTLEREFASRRSELLTAQRGILSRVGALLVALARQNSLEGRDPRLITDELECGAVAAWLAIDVGELAAALIGLERSGLIERCPPNGLRLRDLAGLARLAHDPSSVAPTDGGPLAAPAEALSGSQDG